MSKSSLTRFIDALRDGADVESAARRAGLGLEAARSFLEAVRDLVPSGTFDDWRAPTAAHASDSASDPSPSASTPGASLTTNRRPLQTGGLRVSALADGASRGNPGPAACAVILFDEKGDELLRRSKKLGAVTNNVAEYHGVILALETAAELGASALELKLDSELVVKQLNLEYKVKHDTLKPLFVKVHDLMRRFTRVDVIHVPRTETTMADKLANDELDNKTS